MKILADFHHSGLFYSFYLTLEKRLGYKVFRPIGLDWFNNGFWKIAEPYGNNPDTIDQFLKIDSYFKPKDGTPALNFISQTAPTHYEVAEMAHGYIQKAITFQQFLDMDIDVIIASIPAHYEVYKKLRDKYKPKAKVVCHAGNMFNELPQLLNNGTIENFMGSIIKIPTPNIPTIFYHQEIDLFVFDYNAPRNFNKITSFVIGLPKRDIYDAYKTVLNKYEFKAYGADDGFVSPISMLSFKMSEASMAWHIKPRGDGFGHVIYSWAFSGRPIITNFSDYADKMGGELLVDGQTAINLEANTFDKNIEKIKDLTAPDKLLPMCEAISKRTRNLVNYELEAQNMAKFMALLR